MPVAASGRGAATTCFFPPRGVFSRGALLASVSDAVMPGSAKIGTRGVEPALALRREGCTTWEGFQRPLCCSERRKSSRQRPTGMSPKMSLGAGVGRGCRWVGTCCLGSRWGCSNFIRLTMRPPRRARAAAADGSGCSTGREWRTTRSSPAVGGTWDGLITRDVVMSPGDGERVRIPAPRPVGWPSDQKSEGDVTGRAELDRWSGCWGATPLLPMVAHGGSERAAGECARRPE